MHKLGDVLRWPRPFVTALAHRPLSEQLHLSPQESRASLRRACGPSTTPISHPAEPHPGTWPVDAFQSPACHSAGESERAFYMGTGLGGEKSIALYELVAAGLIGFGTLVELADTRRTVRDGDDTTSFPEELFEAAGGVYRSTMNKPLTLLRIRLRSSLSIFSWKACPWSYCQHQSLARLLPLLSRETASSTPISEPTSPRSGPRSEGSTIP